jgi:hypothetical protein
MDDGCWVLVGAGHLLLCIPWARVVVVHEQSLLCAATGSTRCAWGPNNNYTYVLYLYSRRQMCHRTLRHRHHAKAEREFAQLSCWRAEAKPVGAPATGPPDRRQRHPARPGPGQPWIMDARCHALCTCRQAGCFSFLHRMHAFARQTRWPTPSTDLPATYREATAAPTNTTHVHVLSPPCSVRSIAF